MVITSGVVALAIAFVATPICRWAALRRGMFDVPNERSSHSRPTPRIGGVAIVIAFVCAVAVAVRSNLDLQMLIILGGTCAIAALGFVDDLRGLSQVARFLAQVGVSIAVVFGAHIALETFRIPDATIDVAASGAILSVLWLLSLTNAFNFMDGINGIASLQALAAGMSLAIMFVLNGDSIAAAASVALGAAALGFLPWNLPSGSIFMGDGGSVTFGFGFAALVLRLATSGGSFLAGVLIFTPFLLDTGLTLARRIFRRERFFSAHRSHYYQRLVNLGWSHAATSLLWFGLAVLSSGAALAVELGSPALALILGGAVVTLHLFCFGVISAAEQRLLQVE
jgi:UDP-N-acetylmuramyl pentapeptide phosphotransferase/UDP-N-acetylglucosamine-1-phosphate transferase